MLRTVVRSAILGALVLASATATGTASRDIFVHGRNSGVADINDYWHVGYGGNNDGVLGFTGGNQTTYASEPSYTYGYDASQAWDSNASGGPACQLVQALYRAPGTNFALIGHSAGGPVALYTLSAAKKGWLSTSSCGTCTYSSGSTTQCNPGTAITWASYVIPVAAPFRGTEVADAVYGHTGGNFLQELCGTVAGSVANLVFNEASPMTYELQTSYMNNNQSNITSYGTFSAIYASFGTSTGGDDGTALSGAAYCANLESNNDGFISANSATGCARGTSINWNVGPMPCLPNTGGTDSHGYSTHVGWWDGVSHSSNRRDDYNTFATHVFQYSPY
jgi:hypothetical protein